MKTAVSSKFERVLKWIASIVVFRYTSRVINIIQIFALERLHFRKATLLRINLSKECLFDLSNPHEYLLLHFDFLNIKYFTKEIVSESYAVRSPKSVNLSLNIFICQVEQNHSYNHESIQNVFLKLKNRQKCYVSIFVYIFLFKY